MDLELSDDVALVTASTRGLGFASAKAFAGEGAHVTICGRDEERLSEAEAALEGVGEGGVMARSADLTDPDAVTALVDVTAEAFGGIDHLVTSAGGPPSGPFLDMDDRDWYGAYDTLLMSAVWTLREAYPYLDDSEKGTWTAITSRSVEEVVDGLVLSNSVRRAVEGLVKTVSREFAPSVRANTVLPGAHATERIEYLVEAAVDRGEYDTIEASRASWTDGVPLERLGNPEEFGNVVAFVASDRASYVNGASVPVDGGSLRS